MQNQRVKSSDSVQRGSSETNEPQNAFEIIHEMECIRESCNKLEVENKGLLHDVVSVKQQNRNLNARNHEISAKYDAIQKELGAVSEQVKCLELHSNVKSEKCE